MTDQAELARTGDLDDVRVTRYLDTLDVPDITALLNAPVIDARIHVTPGATERAKVEGRDVERTKPGRWRPGEPKPGLADEDPAVMAAIARCAVARWRSDRTYGDLARTASHPEPCGWCAYPTAELVRALDWADHYARLIEAEAYVWRRGHSAYRRDSGRTGVYENPAWQTFAALPAKEQRFLVDKAVEASRAMLDPIATPAAPAPGPRDHLPWCDLRPDHAGDCPPMPDDPEGP